ncbi:flagellar motor protein MotB [Sphingorhabdus sp. M41]|uniref:flagellar motor protein MotB n=1 Tax=Sphingorhabdus sp. M41 TaxID=1806885 RepID=UPI00078B4F15|nr:flagellar motor protein MotB [Sphingorhabdus sp. M41]AMO72624.1 flagellar motor protein MotB [Sphingorhabdus sp. M41]
MAAGQNDQRPIIIKRVKKVSGGHHGGAWKVAYADFVTAMMAFFMLLWLLSVPDKEVLKGLATYFTVTSAQASSGAGSSSAGGASSNAAGDTVVSQGTPASEAATAGVARGGEARVPDAPLRVMAQELRISISSSEEGRAAKEHIRFEQTPDSLRIDLMDSSRRSMFKPNTAQLNDFARNLLARIARNVSGSRMQLAIEGHTDGVGGLSENNWQLSGQRAHSAHRAMAGAGLSADRFARIVAMAGTQPVYPGQPERPENRRITIVLEPQGSLLPATTDFQF